MTILATKKKAFWLGEDQLTFSQTNTVTQGGGNHFPTPLAAVLPNFEP